MSGSLEITVAAPEATHVLGRRLGESLVGGERIAVIGDLGAGKTAFVRGLAEGLAIDPKLVYSPTFTLVAEHFGRIPLRHIDLYRLRNPVGWPEAEEIGLCEALAAPGATAIEWFDRLAEDVARALPATIRVEIDVLEGDARRIRIAAPPALIDDLARTV